jgi:hypothetical protein
MVIDANVCAQKSCQVLFLGPDRLNGNRFLRRHEGANSFQNELAHTALPRLPPLIVSVQHLQNLRIDGSSAHRADTTNATNESPSSRSGIATRYRQAGCPADAELARPLEDAGEPTSQMSRSDPTFRMPHVGGTYGVAGYYSSYDYDGPVIGHFGFGLRQRVSKHLAFRPEVQLVTFHVVQIGARFVAGLSVIGAP